MTTGNAEIINKKYHPLATVAAFVSVVLVSCAAILFGPLLIITMVVYRWIFPKKERSARELADDEWQMKHHSMVVSRH